MTSSDDPVSASLLGERIAPQGGLKEGKSTSPSEIVPEVGTKPVQTSLSVMSTASAMGRVLGRDAMNPNTLLDLRTAAYEIAAKTGYDARTVLKALRDERGADAIKPLRMRETLRPHVDAYRARLGGGVTGEG